jgi:hypothetical protein
MIRMVGTFVAEQAPMFGCKTAAERSFPVELEVESGLTAREAEIDAHPAADLIVGDTPGGELGAGFRRQTCERRPEIGQHRFAQHRSPGVGLHVVAERSEADAERREDASERVKDDRLDPEQVGDQAGVLTAGAAEHHERVGTDIVAARYRHLSDRLGHVGVCDAEQALGDLLDVVALFVFEQALSHRLQLGNGRPPLELEGKAIRQ